MGLPLKSCHSFQFWRILALALATRTLNLLETLLKLGSFGPLYFTIVLWSAASATSSVFIAPGITAENLGTTLGGISAPMDTG